MKRRNFIKSGALLSGSIFVPNFVKLSGQNPIKYTGKNLIIIQFDGGNDGLNTIVPHRNDVYYSSRPGLAHDKNSILKVNDELGFHPAYKTLLPVYDNGDMSIINNVGYPNPDRSHFKSMDIWHTASGSDQTLTSGWLGRYLDQLGSESKPYSALEMGNNLSLALKGERKKGFVMTNPNQLKRTSNNRILKLYEGEEKRDKDPSISYLYKTLVETQSSANYLFNQSRIHSSNSTYGQDGFSRGLKSISELITANTDTSIYYISLSGFDTHANQKNTQARLLEIYSKAVSTLIKDLKKNQLFDDTLILTFSEFGRRVKQNASNGTDHGTANSVYLMSGSLKQPGFYNKGPNLLDLDNGDLKYEIDFRRIYKEIIGNWLDADPSVILGKDFKKMGLI
jgi:uncharacterized protein (DUF1501 family)